MNLEQQWCYNTSCREFGRVRAGNIKVFSYREQRYYCTTCGRTFSADKGTFFETLRSDHQMITEALAWLMERNSLRAVERRTHHPHDTILHWVDLAGQHAAQVSHTVIRDLHVTQAQVIVAASSTSLVNNSMDISPPALPDVGYGQKLHLALQVEVVSS